jgi:hypothetical protein
MRLTSGFDTKASSDLNVRPVLAGMGRPREARVMTHEMRWWTVGWPERERMVWMRGWLILRERRSGYSRLLAILRCSSGGRERKGSRSGGWEMEVEVDIESRGRGAGGG